MKIEINNLTFKCIMGILDLERIKNHFVIFNISFNYVFAKDFFIDYAEVSMLLKTTMKTQKFLLLEDAILYIENLLLHIYPITNLQIKISKPDILKDCIVTLSNY